MHQSPAKNFNPTDPNLVHSTRRTKKNPEYEMKTNEKTIARRDTKTEE